MQPLMNPVPKEESNLGFKKHVQGCFIISASLLVEQTEYAWMKQLYHQYFKPHNQFVKVINDSIENIVFIKE